MKETKAKIEKNQGIRKEKKRKAEKEKENCRKEKKPLHEKISK